MIIRDPHFAPMAPRLVREPFHCSGWVYEEKVDGYRMLAYKTVTGVRLVSRNGVDHTRRYPDVAAGVARLKLSSLVLDGELAVFDQQLRSRFEWLRDPPTEDVATPPVLIVFDVLLGEHLHEAEMSARVIGDQNRLARIAVFMANQCLATGDYGAAVRFCQEALSIARTLGNRSIEVIATSNLGTAYARKGDFRDAASFLERNVVLEGHLRYERFGDPSSSPRSRGPNSPTYSLSAAGSMRPSGTPRPRYRSLRWPIIPTRCAKECSISAAPSSVARWCRDPLRYHLPALTVRRIRSAWTSDRTVSQQSARIPGTSVTDPTRPESITGESTRRTAADSGAHIAAASAAAGG